MRWALFGILIILAAAHGQTLERKKAISLNDQACELATKSMHANQALRRAIRLLDEAIRLDSMYEMPYLNKASFLCGLMQRKAAVKTLDRLAALHPQTPGYLSKGGNILERMGNHRAATQRYLHDIALCDSTIAHSPDSMLLETKVFRAFLFMLVKGKPAGVAECEKLVGEYPGNEFLKGQLDIFYQFDRKLFIKDSCD